jgi:hypothetical protein
MTLNFRTGKIKKVATTWVFTTFIGNTIMTMKTLLQQKLF